jgi:hypothetical protein
MEWSNWKLGAHIRCIIAVSWDQLGRLAVVGKENHLATRLVLGPCQTHAISGIFGRVLGERDPEG